MSPPTATAKAKSTNDKKLALIPADVFSVALKGIKLTPKQRKWLRVYMETLNAAEATRQSYNCKPESAWSMGCENIIKLKLPIALLMDVAGIDDGAILQVVRDGLGAEKAIVASRRENGEWIHEVEQHTDHPTRHRFAELALKVKGHLKERVELEAVIHDPGDYDGKDPLAYIETCLNGKQKGG